MSRWALVTSCLRDAWGRPAAPPSKAAPACAACGAATTGEGKTGKCRSCAAKSRAPSRNFAPRVAKCGDCGKGITAAAKTGLCKGCFAKRFNSLPETRKKRSEMWKERINRPGERERLARQVQRGFNKAMCDPEKRARIVERGKWLLANVINTPEVQAKLKASRKKAGKTISELRMAWCPPEYRDLHRANMATHRMKSAQSREMIERLAAKDELERRAARHLCFSSVVDFMRRYTAVFDHGADKEKRYRVGLVDMTAGELLKRAESKGYSCPQYPHMPGLVSNSGQRTMAA